MTQPPAWILPQRLVIDPNVFITALIARRPDSPPLQIMDAIAENVITPVACRTLIDEFRDVGERPKFRRQFSLDELRQALGVLERKAEMRPDPPEITELCRDPDDNYLFALATANGVSVIVSGDRDLHTVSAPGIRVLTPRDTSDTLAELVLTNHPWGSDLVLGSDEEAWQVAQIRGDDKPLTVVSALIAVLAGQARPELIRYLVTPEAMPSLLDHWTEAAQLLHNKGMSNRPEYVRPGEAIVKMTEDPSVSLRATSEQVLLLVTPVFLQHRPDLPHSPESGGWRVHHIGNPDRPTPGYSPS